MRNSDYYFSLSKRIIEKNVQDISLVINILIYFEQPYFLKYLGS